MVLFHLCFDLSFLGFTRADFYTDPFWLHARTLILSSFLFLVGAGLWLANHESINPRRVLLRFGLLIGCALLISAATGWLVGERFVFFGVIHFIALASLLGLLFVQAGALNLLFAGVFLVVGNLAEFAWFDNPGWRWIGLMTFKPLTNDYVPLLPWFGVVLIGVYAAPWLVILAKRSGREDASGISRALAFMGRHSLLIYMVHQPLLLGVLLLFK
jgi:uncharacterized membrane protein